MDWLRQLTYKQIVCLVLRTSVFPLFHMNLSDVWSVENLMCLPNWTDFLLRDVRGKTCALDTYRVLSVRETSLDMVGHIKTSLKCEGESDQHSCFVSSSLFKHNKKYHLGKCMEKATPLPGTYLNGQGSPVCFDLASDGILFPCGLVVDFIEYSLFFNFCLFRALWLGVCCFWPHNRSQWLGSRQVSTTGGQS